MIAYIFIALAAFFNAVMDAVENENYFESIFKNLNQRFWYKRESWKYNKKIFGYRLDAWHISKSLMVICWVLALVTINCKHWWVVLPMAGIVWNCWFFVFYNLLFKVK
jgi:hypothetical protein